MINIRRFRMEDIEDLTVLMAELGYPATNEVMTVRMKKMESDQMRSTFIANYNEKLPV